MPKRDISPHTHRNLAQGGEGLVPFQAVRGPPSVTGFLGKCLLSVQQAPAEAWHCWAGEGALSMPPALLLIHPHRCEQPHSLRMFSGSTRAPGTKVFAQQELLNYLEIILNLETILSAREPGALQPAHSGSVKARTEAAGTRDIG